MGSILLLFFVSFCFGITDFEDFEREFLKEYQNYKESVLLEFEEYKKIVREEFEKYKRDIVKSWGEYEATDKKTWVEYSGDYKLKKVFNFETGELRIESLTPLSEKEFEEHIRSFIEEDKNTAFMKQKPLKNIENRLKNFKNVKKGKIPKEKILAPVIMGKKQYSEEELKKAINDLLRKGEFYKRKLRNGKTSYGFKVKISKKLYIMAKKYEPYVEREAKKRNLRESLIFAIIHTESSFNPFATSPVPAYGLMQIVPTTGGIDATKIIFGKPVILSPSYLYNAENNITVGSAYLYLLYYVYFKDVKDPLSRLYCSIAAYNTGPGNVARAFTGTRNLRKAIRIINTMTHDEVYRTLSRNLPYYETKLYLKKVIARIGLYKTFEYK
ncbi:MAG TPA: DUF3393 domain-containing protein [Aquifex aeolicus]|nr:DUF3393 domain-containing protein [Aquifex aeolicus]